MRTKIISLALALVAVSFSAQIDRPMPKPGPAPVVNLGKSNEFKLKNGLTVIVVENNKLPRISTTLSIDNKPFALGAKKGVDGLLGEMLGTGTQSLSKDEFNNKIEQLGARVSYWSEGASASALTKYFNEIFGYFADGALNPNFSQAEFDAVKARYIEGLKADAKSVDAAASRMTSVLTYGKTHPFAEYDTEEKISAITLQDVKDYYNKYYKPNNAYLVFVGDINEKDAKTLAEKQFSSWKAGNLAIPALPSVSSVTKTEVDVVNMPNAVQSVISVAYPVQLTKKDPDYYAVQVASTILGGDFNSKLNMNLREAHGWTYGARGGVSDSRYIGRFMTSTTVRNNVTDSAVVETIKEIKGMTLNKVDQTELENVKAKFLGNFVLSLERPQTVASQALTTKTNDLDKNFYASYIQNINKVSVDDVLRVAKKYFKPEQARIIVTGKAEEITPSLRKLGYPINFYDSYGNTIADPAAAKKQVNVTTDEIKAKYLEFVGGATAVSKIKTMVQEGKMSMMNMEGEFTGKYEFPDKSLTLIKIMGIEIKNVFDGNAGYVSQMGQKIDFTPEQVKGLKGYNTVFPVLSPAFAKSKVDGQVSEAGVDFYKVSNTDAKKIEYFNVKTGELAKTEQTISTPQGDILSTTLYKDYKAFDGIKIPTTLETQAGPQSFTVVVTKVEMNKNVTPADFK
ncbi:M16 family metallopeptidase [Chryseobacterium sp. A301]